MATASKTRKLRTNNFTSFLDLFLEKYNLSAESNPSQLHDYASELGAMLPNWKARKSVKEALCRHLFKDNQIEALVPNNKKKRLTIKERVQYCAKTGDVELAEAGVGSEQIDIYTKLPEVTRASNEIQKRQLEQRLPYLSKTSKHFSLEEGLKRIQNINTTKIPTMQDLADVIMMLSMRPAEVATLRIIYYKPEKNPEHAKELLTWIQDAIATRKLCDPVYSISGKCSTGVFSKFLKPYSITAKRLRKIEGKHASRVHGGQNPTSQHLELLSRIAKGDTSDSDLDSDPEPDPETLASTPKPINENTSEIEDIYDLYGSI
ncbi:hypothetical protein C2G38_2261713 [Gigaspora rosea]|uniref:Uncharacterized protein n=1 Tax=Gigaspora rosea TaxID=44941 RepID=A0A397UMG3_9GLOM|nr:hypothetical protein C2G38_2261713 [Gigaspora rosea]